MAGVAVVAELDMSLKHEAIAIIFQPDADSVD
jgi:hypothetical protein